MKYRISCIIVTYNGAKWIQECIDSVIDQEGVEIIVVDNHSIDNTLNLLNQYEGRVTLIKEKTNHGFGKANNIGIRKALEMGADYVCLLNQDTQVPKDLFEKLIGAIEGSNYEDGIFSVFQYRNSDRLEFRFNNFVTDQNNILLDSRSLLEVTFIMAAFWLIPRRTIIEIGLFDPIFHHYGEDVDLCLRAKKKGVPTVVFKDLTIYHYANESNFKLDTNRWYIKQVLIVKHHSDRYVTNMLYVLRENFTIAFRKILKGDWEMAKMRLAVNLRMVQNAFALFRAIRQSKKQGAFMNE